MSTSAPSAAAVAAASAELHLIPLSSIVLEVWAHGLFTVVALLTLWATLFKAKWDLRASSLFAVVVVMFGAGTIHMGLSWWFLITAFTNHGATPDIINALAHTTVWYKAFGASMFSLNVLIADCVFIWRCYVAWNRRWAVTVIPILMTIAGTVLAIISIVGQVEVARTKTPGSVPQHFITFSTPYFGLSLATSLYATIVIAVRVALLRRDGTFGQNTKGILGVERSAVSSMNLSRLLLLEVPAEAAAVYSANLIAFIIFLAKKNSKLDYPQNIHPQVAGIAVCFIVFRVMMGYSSAIFRSDSPSQRPLKEASDSDTASM